MQASGTAQSAHGDGFRRSIGLFSGTAINMTQMCGIGPFITIPIMVATMGGPQAIVGWIVGAILALADGMVWAELGAAMPGAGGTYVYLREAFQYRTGKLMPFLFIWTVLLTIPLLMSTGIIGLVEYLGFFFPHLGWLAAHLIGLAATALVVLLLYRRIESIGSITIALWVIMLVSVIGTSAAGFSDFHPDMAFTYPPGAFGGHFFVGLGAGLIIGIYDYLGYFTTAYMGDELRDPGRTMPGSIIISVIAMMFVYLILNISVLGVAPWQEIAASRSVASLVVEHSWGHLAAAVMTILIIVTAFASVFAGLLGGSRVPYQAAHEKVFLAVFGRLHAKHGFPHVALLVMGVVTAAGTFFDLTEVISMLLAATIIVQSAAQIVALVVLRKRQPGLRRPYRQWLYPVPCVIAMLGWIYVYVSASAMSLIRSCPARGSSPASWSSWPGPGSTSPGRLHRWKSAKPGLGMTDAMRTRIQHAFGPAVALALLMAAAAAHAENTFAPTKLDRGTGYATEIAHWEIQSSSTAQDGGAGISTDGFATRGWYPVSGRATVMAGLMENGKYKDVFQGDNLRTVARHHFVIPWWYRAQFDLAKTHGLHTLLRVNGMIASADVWVDGHQVADHSTVAGAYPVHVFDITQWVRQGVNTLALRVHPGDPQTDFLMGRVDWNPAPPDNNMGPWRGVDILQTGPVELRFPQVTSKLSLPDLEHAALTVKVDVRNLDNVPHDTVVTGKVAGVALQQKVRLAAGQIRTVVFSSANNPSLALAHPKVWWPAGMGEHPLYHLQLAAAVDGAVSDRTATTFGIRSVRSSLTKQGYRRFFINGKPVLIRGAGWAPDMFLRVQPKRLEAEFSYISNMGLNAIRSEGKLEGQHFYDLADRYGIMILPGWECCDKWESAAKTGGEPWDAADVQVAEESMASEARLLRNHPSVIAFLIGSDNAPPPAIAKMYVDTLHAADWPTPIVSAASDQATAVAGPSGMKMAGPYAWVPPAYWYADKLGGAFGFDSEVGAGADIPRLEDLERMLSPLFREALWKYPEVRQYHATAAWSPFATLARFDHALAERYGAPVSLRDYVQKAQLANYDNVRAQFEAFNAHMDSSNPSTGVIFWMLNNAWPSLHWHLFDYYLNPAGAFFGAKKANEPVHIQYSYDTRGIVLVNHTLTDQYGLQARVRVRNLDGSVRYDKRFTGIEVEGNHTLRLTRVPEISGLSRTYFVELDLESGDGKPVSRNVYWLSTQPDQLDWAHSNWYTTPVTRYADLTALQSLPMATSEVHATTRREGDDDITMVTLTLPALSKAVALFQHVSIRRSAHGELALPILWSDNDVTLWPGESLTLTARYAAQGTAAPVIEVSGWNAPVEDVPASTDTGRH